MLFHVLILSGKDEKAREGQTANEEKNKDV